MTEQLTCYAASEAHVASLLGLGLTDPTLAERHWRWALRFGTDPQDRRWDLLTLSTRSLLWLGDPGLPLDGPADGYWHGLEAIVGSCASAVLAVPQLAVAADLDAVLADAGADPALLPRALSHRPRVDLPAAEYVDARVVSHADAVEIARFRAVVDETEDPLSVFLAHFLTDEGADADLWLFSPGMPLLVRRAGGPPPTS